MKNLVRKFVFIGLAFAGSSGFGEFVKGSDEKGEYVIGSDGAKHYYLFVTAKEARFYSMGDFANKRENAQAGKSDTKWEDKSIYTLEKDTSYNFNCQAGMNANVYGFEFETVNNKALQLENTSAGGKFSIGEYGIHSVSGNDLVFLRTNGAPSIHLLASQTWSGPDLDALSSNPFLIIPNYLYSAKCRNYVTAEDDTTLTLAGDLVVSWNISGHALTNMDMVIKSPATIAIHKGEYGYGELNVRKLTFDGGCGVKFGSDLSHVPYTSSGDNKYAGAKTYGIGSVPLITPVQVAETIELKNGATLKAIETTTVSGGVTIVSSGTITNKVEGVLKFVDDGATFHIEEGSALDLSAAAFTGTGKIAFTGVGDVVFAISGAADEFLHLPDFSGHTGELSVIVASGTLVLENAAAIPEGCTIVTEGEGGVLVIDDTGFDAETMLGGTKKKVKPSRLVVTDADVEGEVSVENGETLNVFGNGLGENASIKLWGGATVMFRESATISSPVWSTNTVTFKTFDQAVTGTVAGVYDTKGESQVRFDSPGLLILSGGGRLQKFQMRSGRVDVIGEYGLYGVHEFIGGNMKVRDGGKLEVLASWQQLRMDKNGAGKTCFEIAENGSYIKSAGNCTTYVGSGNTAGEAKLLINGGYFKHDLVGFYFQAGGLIEINSGEFRVRRRITCSGTKENSKIIVRNGTMTLEGGKEGPAFFEGSGTCTVSIEGRAVLNISTGQTDRKDTTNDTPQATWKCAPGARLKVIGTSHDNTILTLHNFNADGLVFDINDIPDRTDKGVKVKFVDPGENVAVGYVLPGISGNEFMPVAGEGASVRLNASYVVPEGVTFDAASLPQGWYSGFAETAVSNLVFETGSTLQFPFPTAPYVPLSIAGSLTLPAAMNYTATGTSKPKVKLATIVDPAEGIIQGEEECVWTSTGWLNPEYATFSAVEGKLVFSYDPPGTVIVVR